MNIVTKELSRLQRDLLLEHFLALYAEDRRLRFGVCLSDQAVSDYVARIDFGRDAVFGVFDDDMRIAAERGEADAYLELLPGDAASIANALIADRVALFDYALKSQVHAAKRLTAAWAGSKQE